MKKYLIVIFTVVLMFFLVSPVEALGIGQGNILLLDTYQKIVCGDNEVPYIAAQITSTVYMILQIATPIIIILLGMIDLLKAVMAQKEDDIKKGQQTFVKRLFIGAGVFLVFVLVKAIIGLVAPANNNTGMWNCVDCFISGDNCNNKTTVDTISALNSLKNVSVGDSVDRVNEILGATGESVMAGGSIYFTWKVSDDITFTSDLMFESAGITGIGIDFNAHESLLRETLASESVDLDKVSNMDFIAGIDYSGLVSKYGAEGTLIYKGTTYNEYVWVEKDGNSTYISRVRCDQNNSSCYTT